MEWTGLNDLRSKFLKFYESKGHIILPSASLVPRDDNSLLLINSGMAPLKKYFLGLETPPNHRVTTCQKCIRTPDIDSVGHDDRHGTYFEMLGNFSFGDYFKKEAIAWSWEFLTSPEWVGLEADRLYPSVFEGNETTPADDEAFRIWNEEIGIPAERIFKFGKEDNFWEHGSGPCGPCSEIYYDRGPEWGCGKPTCTVGCDCDRYIEVWNIVFSQFDNDGEGHYTELKQKNIDTGMGLERLAVVCQNVPSLFDVDTVMNITNKVSDITGAHYGDSQASDVSLRIITDHIRSATFMICDGVLPSNEGRGYVLRRLLRRAARHGKLLPRGEVGSVEGQGLVSLFVHLLFCITFVFFIFSLSAALLRFFALCRVLSPLFRAFADSASSFAPFGRLLSTFSDALSAPRGSIRFFLPFLSLCLFAGRAKAAPQRRRGVGPD